MIIEGSIDSQGSSKRLVRHPEGSYVYAAQLPSGIKIGKTNNPVATLRTFKRPCPDACYVNVWWFRDESTAYLVESYLHELLAQRRLGGELFDLEDMIDVLEDTAQSTLATMAELRQGVAELPPGVNAAVARRLRTLAGMLEVSVPNSH